MTTMGVYVRDLLLGQYYFDTLLPRIPVPVLRQITGHLERMKLPTKTSGATGENSRQGSDDTARRPPSVKAALSVSFGQRAPHRASTRDSSPVRRALPSHPYDGSNNEEVQRSPSNYRSRSREISDREYSDRNGDRGKDRYGERDRDRNGYRDRDRDRDRARGRDRDWDKRQERSKDREDDRERDKRHDYDRRSRYSDRESRRDCESSRRRESSYWRSRSESRSPSRRRSRSRSQGLQASRSEHVDYQPSSHRDNSKDKSTSSSNLAKLRDLYGDLGDSKKGEGVSSRDSGTEEVIRLGGSSWK